MSNGPFLRNLTGQQMGVGRPSLAQMMAPATRPTPTVAGPTMAAAQPLDIAGLRRQVLAKATAPKAPQSRQALMAKYGLAPTAPAPKPSPMQRLSAALPAAGTPQMAGLGAAGRTMLELSGYQPIAQAPSIGQILARSAEAGIGTMRERQAELAAAARQKEQDELDRRYREAQIKQMGQEKGLEIKKPYSVEAVRDGVRGTVQKQYLGIGAPGADQYGVVEIPNSFVPDPAKAPLVSMPGDDEALKYAYKRLEKTGEEASKAQELVNSYDRIILTLEANPDIETGPVQDAILPFKQLFADFGLLSQDEVNEVMTLERLRANMSFIVPRMREEGSGSTSNFEMGVFKEAAPQLSKRRDTNLLLAAAAKQSAQYKTLVQSEREAFVLENKRLPKKAELTAIMDAKHGSIFKTPFGQDIRVKSEDEVNQEFNRMYTEGIIRPGDVVYLGEYGGFTYIDKPFLQAAGLIQ